MPWRPAVLVVEDEPLLLMNAVDVVEEAGFAAVAARDADEAFAILPTRTDIRIVFTAIDMPGSMDGLKLAVAARDRWPPLEIVVASGHYRPAMSELPDRSVFAKPCDAGRVTAALQRLAG